MPDVCKFYVEGSGCTYTLEADPVYIESRDKNRFLPCTREDIGTEYRCSITATLLSGDEVTEDTASIPQAGYLTQEQPKPPERRQPKTRW